MPPPEGEPHSLVSFALPGSPLGRRPTPKAQTESSLSGWKVPEPAPGSPSRHRPRLAEDLERAPGSPTVGGKKLSEFSPHLRVQTRSPGSPGSPGGKRSALKALHERRKDQVHARREVLEEAEADLEAQRKEHAKERHFLNEYAQNAFSSAHAEEAAAGAHERRLHGMRQEQAMLRAELDDARAHLAHQQATLRASLSREREVGEGIAYVRGLGHEDISSLRARLLDDSTARRAAAEQGDWLLGERDRELVQRAKSAAAALRDWSLTEDLEAAAAAYRTRQAEELASEQATLEELRVESHEAAQLARRERVLLEASVAEDTRRLEDTERRRMAQRWQEQHSADSWKRFAVEKAEAEGRAVPIADRLATVMQR